MRTAQRFRLFCLTSSKPSRAELPQPRFRWRIAPSGVGAVWARGAEGEARSRLARCSKRNCANDDSSCPVPAGDEGSSDLTASSSALSRPSADGIRLACGRTPLSRHSAEGTRRAGRCALTPRFHRLPAEKRWNRRTLRRLTKWERLQFRRHRVHMTNLTKLGYCHRVLYTRTNCHFRQVHQVRHCCIYMMKLNGVHHSDCV